MNFIKKILVHSIPIAYMGAIIYLSHLPGSDIDLPMIPYIDKLYHGLEYAILTGLIVLSFLIETRYTIKQIFFPVLVFISLFALSDEIHQYFVPGRSSSGYDLLADIAGCIFVLILFRYMKFRRSNDS